MKYHIYRIFFFRNKKIMKRGIDLYDRGSSDSYWCVFVFVFLSIAGIVFLERKNNEEGIELYVAGGQADVFD